MKDTREALPADTLLEFTSAKKGTVLYQILREFGRGASCIVYEAFYVTNAGTRQTVRIKECFPFRGRIRREKGQLFAEEDSSDSQTLFQKAKEDMYRAFRISSELFQTGGLTNSISNSIDIYQANNTVYIVSSYLQGMTLSERLEKADRPFPLYDRIGITESIAAAVSRIHEKGYLYLDLKPDNIFVLEETTELVQLFDFDSLRPIKVTDKEEEGCRERIAYTPGFAALEQRLGRQKSFGPYTDVYGIGALLFFLLFGRTPDASDCDPETSFLEELEHNSRFLDLIRGRLDDERRKEPFRMAYRERFPYALEEFFHHTLANYYPDRYSGMHETLKKLKQLKEYADEKKPFLILQRIRKPSVFVGREKELHEIERWIEGSDCGVFFLTGIGGIGKSALIRYFLAEYEPKAENIIYLSYHGSLAGTLADDRQIAINTIRKMEEESAADYASRKLRMMKELTAGEKTILVIDQYDGAFTEERSETGRTEKTDEESLREAIFNGNWHVIPVTRNRKQAEQYPGLILTEIAEKRELQELFEDNLGRKLLKEEESSFLCLADSTGGHTLAMELIAKQIRNSFLSMREAARLTELYGFSSIAQEKVYYHSGTVTEYETVNAILTAMFDAGKLSGEARCILRSLSWFSDQGIDSLLLKELCGFPSFNRFHELKESGWIILTDRTAFLHPVIREMINRLDWTLEEYRTACRAAEYLCRKLEEDDSDRKEGTGLAVMLLSGWEENKKPETRPQNAADLFLNLAFLAAGNLSREEEGTFLLLADQVFGQKREEIAGRTHADRLQVLLPKTFRTRKNMDVHREKDAAMMKLYDTAVGILMRKEDAARAEELIREADTYRREKKDPYLNGIYYELLSDFYDFRLAGEYQFDNAQQDRKKLLESMDAQIREYRKADTREARYSLTRACISKAIIMIRSFPEKKREIQRQLVEIKKILCQSLDEEARQGDGRELFSSCPISDTREWTEILCAFDMVRAWYYTYVEENCERSFFYISSAEKKAVRLPVCLDRIEEVLIPAANILAEHGDRRAGSWLRKALALCEEKKGIIPYEREKEEIQSILQMLEEAE